MSTKTNFRVAKCLCYEGKGCQTIRDCAITDDGKKHIIQETKDGEKYFTIDNPYSNNTLRDRHFHGRIGDAIQAIKEGYADVILSGGNTNVFNEHDYPIVMINRQIGDEYRQKSIKGFKDTKIGYCIFYGNKNSFGGYHPVDAIGDMAMIKEPMIYDSEEEAQNKLNYYIEEATKLAKSSINDKNEFLNIKSDGVPSIVNDIAWDMIEELPNDKVRLRDDLLALPHIGFEVRQEIKNE